MTRPTASSQSEGSIRFPKVPGKTPEECRANYSKMLMTFVRTNPDIGMISDIRSIEDVNAFERHLFEEGKGQVSLYTLEDPADDLAMGHGTILFSLVPGKTPEECRVRIRRMLKAFAGIDPEEGGP